MRSGTRSDNYGTVNFIFVDVSVKGERSIARFEVSTAVKIHAEFFWVVMSCSDMVGYEHFTRSME
jgi:hypothetical protein